MRRPKIAVEVAPESAGRSLLDLVRAVAELARDEAAALIARGGVWLDARRCLDAALPVAAGQALAIHFAPTDGRPAVIHPADILYEDAALLVLNKRPGDYVNVTPWDVTGDVLWAAGRYLAARDGEAPPLHLAHQLDRDTSGVLVISKHPRANAPLLRAFLDHTVHKCYLALATGTPEDDSFEVLTGHGRGERGRFRVYPLELVGARSPDGKHTVKPMETRFHVIERWPEAALVEARPITGRTHQIRLHLAHAGHPVAGDTRYDGPTTVAGVPLAHHLLHAAVMELPHPFGRGPLRLEAPLPALWQDVLAALRCQEVA